MKILVNNDVKQMTVEQEAALMEMPEQKQEPTVEERIADLEVSNAELREALDLILSGGIE